MKSQPKPRWLLPALAITACIIFVGLVLTHHETPLPAAPVILLKTPYTMPAQTIGFLDRVMPVGPSWGWLWKVRYALIGKPRQIDINIVILDLQDLDLSTVAGLAKPDVTTADGLQVCRITEADFKKAQLLITKPEQILSSPRLTTGNESQCSFYCGSSVVLNGTTPQFGITADVLPLIRKDTIDLTAIFRCSEVITNPAGAISVRTNLDVAGRFQLSQSANGIFILAGPPRSIEGRRLALMVASKVQRPKK